jgi:hypothetical protein
VKFPTQIGEWLSLDLPLLKNWLGATAKAALKFKTPRIGVTFKPEENLTKSPLLPHSITKDIS